MTKMLVSVRCVVEALLAADRGADFIDLKEPGAGALGGLPVDTITAVVAALRRSGSRLPVSATIGDLPMTALAPILAQVQAVAGCGVDYVKVGIERHADAAPVLRALAASGHAVVPVFIADRGLDVADLHLACSLGFPGLMVDTADKTAGSLFDVMATGELRAFLQAVRGSGALAGLAGALRLHHLPALLEMAPDFAGFRSAVCDGDRAGALDPQRLQALALALALRAQQPVLQAAANAPATA
jgi:(5-formylfuran-3-yl)methyl phosphate synthase